MNSKTTTPSNVPDDVNAGVTNDLLQALRCGDAAAAETLFHRYARRLAQIAKKYLSLALARRVDAEDVTQSVFRTFFRRAVGGEIHIDSANDLWRLLAKMTITKVHARYRRHSAAMRDIRVEVSLERVQTWQRTLTTEPKAMDAIALADAVQVALQDLPDFYPAILELRLRGFAVVEIALRLQKSTRSIYRALDLLKIRLARTISSRE